MTEETFADKLAVVTGGGSGMGRELVRQLAAQGCSVAACDWNAESIAQAAAAARPAARPGVRVTGHVCDVCDEAQVLRFRDELLAEHASDHVDLVFSNAGIGGGGSFVNGSREEWERTFVQDLESNVMAVSLGTGKALWKDTYDSPSHIHLPRQFCLEPGIYGGVETQLASNGSTTFAAVNDVPSPMCGPATGCSLSRSAAIEAVFKATGEMVAGPMLRWRSAATT